MFAFGIRMSQSGVLPTVQYACPGYPGKIESFKCKFGMDLSVMSVSGVLMNFTATPGF